MTYFFISSGYNIKIRDISPGLFLNISKEILNSIIDRQVKFFVPKNQQRNRKKWGEKEVEEEEMEEREKKQRKQK